MLKIDEKWKILKNLSGFFSFAVGNFEIRNEKCISTVILCYLIPKDEENIVSQFFKNNPDVGESALANDTDQSKNNFENTNY